MKKLLFAFLLLLAFEGFSQTPSFRSFSQTKFSTNGLVIGLKASAVDNTNIIAGTVNSNRFDAATLALFGIGGGVSEATVTNIANYIFTNGAVVASVVQTNFNYGGIGIGAAQFYTNTSGSVQLIGGTAVEVFPSASNPTTNHSKLLMAIDQNGGNSFTAVPIFQIYSGDTNGIQIYSSFSIPISSGAVYYFTNASQGAGTAAIESGTVTTLGSGGGGSGGVSSNEVVSIINDNTYDIDALAVPGELTFLAINSSTNPVSAFTNYPVTGFTYGMAKTGTNLLLTTNFPASQLSGTVPFGSLDNAWTNFDSRIRYLGSSSNLSLATSPSNAVLSAGGFANQVVLGTNGDVQFSGNVGIGATPTWPLNVVRGVTGAESFPQWADYVNYTITPYANISDNYSASIAYATIGPSTFKMSDLYAYFGVASANNTNRLNQVTAVVGEGRTFLNTAGAAARLVGVAGQINHNSTGRVDEAWAFRAVGIGANGPIDLSGGLTIPDMDTDRLLKTNVYGVYVLGATQRNRFDGPTSFGLGEAGQSSAQVAIGPSNTSSNTTGGSGVTNVILRVAPVYNQTGSASATDLKINRTGNYGSGAQLLLDLQESGVSRFRVNTLGVISGQGFTNFGNEEIIGTLNVGGLVTVANAGILGPPSAKLIVAATAGRELDLTPGAGAELNVNLASGGRMFVKNGDFNVNAGTVTASGGFITPGGATIGGTLSVTNNAWFGADVSALTFTDRSKSPASLKDAYEIVASIKTKNGHVDHDALSPKAWGTRTRVVTNTAPRFVNGLRQPRPATNSVIEPDKTKRDLGMVISAQALVIQDLMKRLEKLESK